uniref:FCH and mu domain containing endocytic adaptor 1 n=1 Tax=Molossus molossus TaxID=27622 RepID=A0A7J8I757_MOLMO|nr:FCH and mu domain containing endocytic adaptor 1 [Molossus molossus]
MWPITAPVSVSHWTLFPQQLPRVELSAQVWTQLAQGADLLSIPDCVTLGGQLEFPLLRPKTAMTLQLKLAFPSDRH